MEKIKPLKPVSVLYLDPLFCGEKLECSLFQFFRLVRKVSKEKRSSLLVQEPML
jgi:hypothetical protein